MKIRKRLIALVMMAVMVFGLLPMNAQAAESSESSAYWFSTRTGNVKCDKYDLDGDGKKDVIEYKKPTSRYFIIYINGKKQKISTPSSSYVSSYFGLFNIENDNTYLVASTISRSGQASTKAYYYQRGAFRSIRPRNYGKIKFENMYPKYTKGDMLYMCSTAAEKKNYGMLASFQGSKQDIGMLVSFRFGNGAISINLPQEVEVASKSTLNFYSIKGIFTSTTPGLADYDGPAIRPGHQFKVEKFYIDRNLKIICQVSYRGEKGWFDCSDKSIVIKDAR